MSDPVANLISLTEEAGVELDDQQREWLERMRREHGEDVQFELWTLP
ncbi:hypothetical protein ABT061_29155 [Streptosporangium sp. NPDC002544]